MDRRRALTGHGGLTREDKSTAKGPPAPGPPGRPVANTERTWKLTAQRRTLARLIRGGPDGRNWPGLTADAYDRLLSRGASGFAAYAVRARMRPASSGEMSLCSLHSKARRRIFSRDRSRPYCEDTQCFHSAAWPAFWAASNAVRQPGNL